ncbi:MAG: SOS response-associated peptidase [Acidiferrobacterales bacterium]
MCGRFTLVTPRERLVSHFRLEHACELSPRYNVAPNQAVAAVRQSPAQGRELVMLRWGLIPYWAEGLRGPYGMINARAETLAQRPAFRAAFARRRCLIPADGFYEWKTVHGRKQPYAIRKKDHSLFALAALWERWQGDEQVVESCAIVTTVANDLVRPLHERMPVVLPPEHYDRWLDPAIHGPAVLQPLLSPATPEPLIVYPVSTRVNSPKNDDAECLMPLDEICAPRTTA